MALLPCWGTHMDTFWKLVPFSWLLETGIVWSPYTELLTARTSSTRSAGTPEVGHRIKRPQRQLALSLGLGTENCTGQGRGKETVLSSGPCMWSNLRAVSRRAWRQRCFGFCGIRD